MKMTKMFMKPGAFALMGILTNTFLGFIISLITAAILKKEPKEFA
jgi:tetrahydromethanopterin S-methyltransferase subunit B